MQACAKHPLARALRPGGLVLSAMQQVAMAYLRRDADTLPFWRMATTSVESLRARADTIGSGPVSETIETIETAAVTGGGTMPDVEIPSVGLALDGDRVDALRDQSPPVIATGARRTDGLRPAHGRPVR